MRSTWKTRFTRLVATASLAMAAFGAAADMVDEGLPEMTTDATVSSQRVTVTGAYMSRGYPTTFPASTKFRIARGGGNFGSGYGNVRGSGTKSAPPLVNPTSVNNSDTDDEDSTCNPVVLATGEKFKDENDFASQGEYGLGLTRTYRSMSTTGMIFGANWSSSLDPLVITPSTAACVPFEDGNCYPRDATISFPGGAKYKYAWNFSDSYYFVNGNAGAGKLQYLGSQNRWKLLRDGNTYEFQYTGPMNRVLDPNNMALLTYTWVLAGQYQITKVTNAVGQYVQFTWTSGRMTTARDPNGGLWSYTYNANGMLATVSSPDSPSSTRTYHYEDTLDTKLLTGITINGTRYSTYKYYSDKRVKESGLATGEERDTFAYTATATTVTSAKGDATTYTFTGPVGAKKFTGTSRPATASCAAASASIAYDANGYPDYAFDWNTNKTDYTYDATGKLTQTTTAAGTADAATVVNLWSDGDITERQFKDSTGVLYAKLVYTYYPLNSGAYHRIKSITHLDTATLVQRVTNYAYTFYANKTIATLTATQTLPSGTSVTTRAYDALGNLTSITNGVGHQTLWSGHNGFGQPGRMTDANGVITDYVYSPGGNIKTATQTLPAGTRTTTYTFNNDRQITDIAMPTGQVVRYRYDAAGKLSKFGNAASEFVQRTFDVPTNTERLFSARHFPVLSNGIPAATVSGNFETRTKFDSLGRPWVVSGNNSQTRTMTYDNLGNIKAVTDAANHVWQYEYDAQSRLKKTTQPDGGVISYLYDTRGNLKSITDPRLLTTSYTYNVWGDVLTKASPDTGLTTYTYDVAGRMSTQTPASNLVVSYSWDAIGRMTGRTVNGATEHYNYDENANGKGHLTSISDGTGTTTYSYNGAGEMIGQVATISPAANTSYTYSTYWSYDAAGRLIDLIYPSGFTARYGYDDYGRVNTVLAWTGTQWITLADSFLYQPATQIRYAWRYGNNRVRMVTRDADNRVTKLYSPSVMNSDLSYNNVDMLTGITNGSYATLTSTQPTTPPIACRPSPATTATTSPSPGTTRATA